MDVQPGSIASPVILLFLPVMKLWAVCSGLYRWQEALTIYPRTNKHNLKKKRKVEPPTPQVIPRTLPVLSR